MSKKKKIAYEIDKIKEFETLTGIHVTYDVITRFEKE